jgi:hypothetical protein
MRTRPGPGGPVLLWSGGAQGRNDRRGDLTGPGGGEDRPDLLALLGAERGSRVYGSVDCCDGVSPQPLPGGRHAERGGHAVSVS